MKTLVWEGTMTALTSISHIGESHGIQAKLRREKVVLPDGSVEEIPVISGNGIRGMLRDRGMLHMVQQLGYGVDQETGAVRGLSLPAFYFLFSGGALTKLGGNRGLDIDLARKWRELIPLVSLFGGAMGNQIMPGKLRVGKAIPICTETAHLLPQRFVPERPRSVWELCQEEAYTRRDDEKREDLRALIAPEERKAIEAEQRKRRDSERAGEDLPVEKTGETQQMRYYIETFAAGARFFWELALDDPTDLEYEALVTTLVEFARRPYIGGKSAVGHGKVSVSFDRMITVDPRTEPTGTEVSMQVGTLYAKHLQEHGDEIRGMIDELK